MSKPSSFFYKAARKIGKTATTLNNIETLLTGNPKKIAKRAVRYKTTQQSHGAVNKLLRKIFK